MAPFDATVKVDDGRIGVHQVVLSAFSELFQKRFQIEGTEVVLPGRVEVVKEVIRFIYTGLLPEAEQMEPLAVEIPLLAADYGVEDLIIPFAYFWHLAISVENVVDVFLRAIKSECAPLIRFCRPIIVANRSCLKLQANSRQIHRLLCCCGKWIFFVYGQLGMVEYCLMNNLRRNVRHFQTVQFK